jgi:hypothetical protein
VRGEPDVGKKFIELIRGMEVMPAATIIVSPAYSTPSIRNTGNCVPSKRRSARALTCAAEARTKSWLILDFLTPKPSRVRSITSP